MSIPRAVLRSTAQMRHRTRKALDVVHLELQRCVDSNVGPSELLRRFDNISDALCQVIDTADFVRCVHPDSSFRDSATEAIQTLSECIQHLNTNQDLYERLANLKRNIEDLNGEERRMAETLRSDFQENGIHLPDDIRARIRNIQYEIAIAGNEFSDNVNTMSIPVRISTDVARVLPNQMRAHVHEYDDFVTVRFTQSLTYLFSTKRTNTHTGTKLSSIQSNLYATCSYILGEKKNVRSSKQYTNQRNGTRTSFVFSQRTRNTYRS